MPRLVVAILMIFIQCFGSVGLARIVCFRGDGSICCICSAWTSSACCERVPQEPEGCKCCGHSQNICDDRNADPIHTSDSLVLSSREFSAVRKTSDCHPVFVMANLEISKSPNENCLLRLLIFARTEFVFEVGLQQRADGNIKNPNPSVRHCRCSVMRC